MSARDGFRLRLFGASRDRGVPVPITEGDDDDDGFPLTPLPYDHSASRDELSDPRLSDSAAGSPVSSRRSQRGSSYAADDTTDAAALLPSTAVTMDNDDPNDRQDEASRLGAYDSGPLLNGSPTGAGKVPAGWAARFGKLWSNYAILRLIPPLLVGCVIWFASPPPTLTPTAMHMLAVFVAVIVSFLTAPFPMSISVLLSLCFLTFTLSFQCTTKDGISVPCSVCGTPDANGTVYNCNAYHDAFAVAVSGYANSTIWLVFAAFQLGRAVQVTGLGKRLSLRLVKLLGRNIVGLGYAVCISAVGIMADPKFKELLLGPIVPSNTARGSIVMAVVTSLCRTLGSSPDHNRQSHGGEYLVLVASHANLIAAATYQTGMAANPIVTQKALDIVGVDWGFGQWLWAACAPSIAAALVLPWSMRILSRSTVDVAAVRATISEDLRAYVASNLGFNATHAVD